LSVLSGVLLAFSYALHPLWWAAWVAPAPGLAAVLLASVAQRRRLGLTTGLIAGVSTFAYHLTVGGWVAALVILGLIALAWASVFRLAAANAERRSALLAVLVVPVAWAAIDTLMIHFSPHGSAGSISYSQMAFLPAVQIASLGGMPAVSFVPLLAGSFLGLVIARALGAPVRGLRSAGALTAMVVGCALLFGIARLSAPQADGDVRVAMLATDGLLERPRDWRSLWQAYGPAIKRAAMPGAVVLLPEAVAKLDAGEAKKAAEALALFACGRAATIVVGVVVTDGRHITNRALVAQADGRAVWYGKQHLVPGLEADMTSGDRLLVLDAAGLKAGVAICKDMHFPTLGRDYALAGAKLMLVPALDFDVDDEMTARMTALRGVEGGYAIARAARRGFSMVSDPFGRIRAEHRSGQALSTLTATVPGAAARRTIYGTIGDAFGWLCVIGLAVLMFVRFREPSPRRGTPSTLPINARLRKAHESESGNVMQVREFRLSDAPALAAIFHASVREGGLRHYSPSQVAAWSPASPDPDFYRRRTNDCVTFVAVDDEDQPVGYGDLRSDGYIDHLYCHPNRIRTGVGSALYAAIEVEAVNAGMATLSVDASDGARILLERRGFHVEERQDFAINGVEIHNYRMSKALSG